MNFSIIFIESSRFVPLYSFKSERKKISGISKRPFNLARDWSRLHIIWYVSMTASKVVCESGPFVMTSGMAI